MILENTAETAMADKPVYRIKCWRYYSFRSLASSCHQRISSADRLFSGGFYAAAANAMRLDSPRR
jgi:hypothetical protein